MSRFFCARCAREVHPEALRCADCGQPFQGPSARQPIEIETPSMTRIEIEITGTRMRFAEDLEPEEDADA